MKKVQVNIEDKIYRFEMRHADGSYYIKNNGDEHKVDLVRMKNNRYSMIIGGRSHEIGVDYEHDGYTVSTGARSERIVVEDYDLARLKKAAGIADVRRITNVAAPMPGLIVRVICEPGRDVRKGDPLLVMEAMKMENDIKSPVAGKIKSVRVAPGESVDKGQALVEFE